MTEVVNKSFILSFVIVCASVCSCAGGGSSLHVSADMPWVTNGTVNTILPYGDRYLFIGGTFTYVGPRTGGGIHIDPEIGGRPTTGFVPLEIVNGRVYTALSDGSGGVCIGGSFTKIGTHTRLGLAHLLSDGSVDPVFTPNLDGANAIVMTMAFYNDSLIVGGSISTVEGQTRTNLAELNRTTGAVSANALAVDSTVVSIAVSGSTLYLGGYFGQIGGTTRNSLASIDLSTWTLTTWNPDVTGIEPHVDAVTVVGSTVYVGGYFDHVGATARNGIASIDASGAAVVAFDPGSGSPTVSSITSVGSNVIVTGNFTSMGGQARSYIAELDATTGNATSLDFASDGVVQSVYQNGDTLYAVGSFTSIGGQSRRHFSALSLATGLANSLDVRFDSAPSTVIMVGSNVYVGGDMKSLGGLTRNYLAKLDRISGQPTSWDAGISTTSSGSVQDLKYRSDQDSILVGGRFSTVSGQSRSHFFEIDPDSAAVSSWVVDVSGGATPIVRNLWFQSSELFVCGTYTTINATARNRLAKVDTSGTVSGWNPNLNSTCNTIDVSSDTVYVGGGFTTVNGATTRRKAAAFDRTTGTVTTWAPSNSLTGTVNDLLLLDSTILVGASIQTLGGQTREGFAEVDLTNGTATSWDAALSNTAGLPSVQGLYANESYILLGGTFTHVSGVSQNNFVIFDRTSHERQSFAPNPDNTVYSIAIDGYFLYLGGTFSKIDGEYSSGGLAILPWNY